MWKRKSVCFGIEKISPSYLFSLRDRKQQYQRLRIGRTLAVGGEE